jgi:excisionase family DNA binding protein
LGSVRQVFFWLDQQQIQLPVARGPEAVREIVWQPARYHGVLSVLNNPVYAGAYAQGRSKTMVRLVDGQKRVRRQRQRRREDWTVLILDHHEGYIDWDAYQSNQTMIAHNDNARGAAVRGSVKHGEALLAGLRRCGHCGAKLLALSTEAQLATELAALQPNRERLLTDAPKREILVFARDLPGLWDDPRSSPEHKKRLLRIALKEIMVTSEEETIRLVLHGEGGDHTQVEFPKIRSGRHRYVTDDDLVEIVRMLARIEPDARIASILNRNRRRTAHGQSWTAKRVCSLRNNHAVPVYREGERQARAEMSASEAAAILGVTPTTVLRLIQHEQLPATQPCVGAPWILRRADVEQCLAERSQSASPPTGDSKQLTLEIP